MPLVETIFILFYLNYEPVAAFIIFLQLILFFWMAKWWRYVEWDTKFQTKSAANIALLCIGSKYPKIITHLICCLKACNERACEVEKGREREREREGKRVSLLRSLFQFQRFSFFEQTFLFRICPYSFCYSHFSFHSGFSVLLHL